MTASHKPTHGEWCRTTTNRRCEVEGCRVVTADGIWDGQKVRIICSDHVQPVRLGMLIQLEHEERRVGEGGTQ